MHALRHCVLCASVTPPQRVSFAPQFTEEKGGRKKAPSCDGAFVFLSRSRLLPSLDHSRRDAHAHGHLSFNRRSGLAITAANRPTAEVAKLAGDSTRVRVEARARVRIGPAFVHEVAVVSVKL